MSKRKNPKADTTEIIDESLPRWADEELCGRSPKPIQCKDCAYVDPSSSVLLPWATSTCYVYPRFSKPNEIQFDGQPCKFFEPKGSTKPANQKVGEVFKAEVLAI